MPVKGLFPTRRHILKTGALAAGAAAAPSGLEWAAALAQEQPFKPEPNARLRLLRWSKFLDAEDAATRANIEAFAKATGVEVRVESEWQDDILPKAAVAANTGQGPDIVWALHTTAHLFPDKLVDLSDVAEHLGKRYGGWFPLCEEYGKSGGKWIAIPHVLVGVLPVFRVSQMKEAGFSSFPKDTDGFLKLSQELKRIGKPGGMAFGKAPNDAATFTHWLLWSHGGKIVDEAGAVAINSPETARALDYARALHASFVEGTVAWNDAANNKAFLAGQISFTNNSVSIYGKARADKMEMADDIDHAFWPIGPAGAPTELHLVFPLMAFAYTKYPNAARALIAYLMEKAQYDRLIEASAGYVSHTLKGFGDHPVWTKDPRVAVFKDVGARGRSIAYAGKLGYAAAGVLADDVVIDLFADVVSGQMPAKDAIAKAEKRIQRYYKV
jgi:multiple sugar transport system substrate-binding protein